MIRTLRLTALLAFISALAPIARAEAPVIEWMHDRDAGFKKAKRAARPLFIYFAEVNKAARITEMSIFDDDDVKTALKDFVCLRIDPFKHEDLAKKFNLKVAFAVGAMTADGEALASFDGRFTAADVVKVAKDAKKKFGRIPSPADIARLSSYIARAERYLASKNYRRAGREVNKVLKSKVRSSHHERAVEIKAAIAKAAAAAIERARHQEANAPGKARSMYQNIKKDFPGSSAADQASERLDALVKEGVVDFAAVEKAAYYQYRKALLLERLDRYADAINAYRDVLAMPTTKYTGMVKAAIERLESDPAVAMAIENAEEEKEAAALFRLAQMWAANDMTAKAVEIYRQITREYPYSTAAGKAWQALRLLGPR